MDNTMKKRWISLYVENQVGVLSKISGLFSGKCYNLESLTVGETEDPTISRMTIGLTSDDITFEQIKKQLNRMVEVIKVIDFTEISVVMQELMFVKVKNCTPEDKTELFQIAQTYQAKVRDYGKDSVLLYEQYSESEIEQCDHSVPSFGVPVNRSGKRRNCGNRSDYHAEEIGKQIKTKKQSALLNFRRSRIIMKFRFRECEIHSIK